MTNSYYPLRSLEQGNWLKLICGASFQHLPSVRNLTLAYALAGVDCIDVSADGAVIAAAQAALQVARSMQSTAQKRGYGIKQLPWLMVSLNASEDPHFRKAAFDPLACPPECPRPCEPICPAQAIVFNSLEDDFSGVLEPNCYGCGRCLPICPSQLIKTNSYVVPKEDFAPLVLSQGVDAVEIHTQVGQYTEFANLWTSVKPWVSKLKLVAISCPDGEGLIDYLWSIYKLISPLESALIWQTDGRPMSGDIGDGTTIAAVKLAQKVLAAKLPGYVQLAGGTNSYTVPKLQKLGMLGSNLKGGRICGVAYGSYARVLLSPILERLEQLQNKTNELSTVGLEQEPQLLWEAVNMAQTLVSQLKPIAC
ncbi:circadian clock protein LdpA [Synechocystis sp. PCC 7509]|uniref:circadian clock protein LdpA n=1 Tax=Synechocystis sp. PCC 7509 TaxID=927677 RepID=UPI0002ACD972|nr:LdpA C-terminal domain-containing domain [Synechocystis sp. PCC 7509]